MKRGLAGFGGRVVLDLRHRHAEFLRDEADGLAECEVLYLLDELEDVARFSTAEAVIELLANVNGERRRLLFVEGTESLEVLRSRLAQLHVFADDANDVRLGA